MSESIWTVERLIEKLQTLPSQMPIVGIYDFDFVRNARKKRQWVKTVTVHDVKAIKTNRSRKDNAVVIETTEVFNWGTGTPLATKRKTTRRAARRAANA